MLVTMLPFDMRQHQIKSPAEYPEDNPMRRSIQDVRVAFVISHPFHFYIYRPLIRKLRNPIVVIETRAKTPFEFDDTFISQLGCDHVILDERDLRLIDQQVAVVFVMTPKHLKTRFSNARTVAVQYGMAKEYYNYGLWRSLADLNMMFGPYSVTMIQGHAVARAVGNTRFDDFQPDAVGGGGVLYAPTYGTLSSLQRFVDVLPRLNKTVAIKVKLHHASEFEDQAAIELLRADPRVTLLDGYHDALDDIMAADIVLSDYSGMVFDAIFLQRPVALFQPGYTQSVKRTTDESIEIARGGDLGEVLRSDTDIIDFFERLAGGMKNPETLADRDDFLSNFGMAVPVALDLLDDLINGDIKRTVVQESLAETYASLLSRTDQQGASGLTVAIRKRIARAVFG